MLALPTEVEELARRLADRTGQSPEAVIRNALEACARTRGMEITDAGNPDQNAVIAAATAITRQYRMLPLLDPRSADEILGYDEFGLPR